MRHLKQTGSNHVYVRTEALAARKDMTECDAKGVYLTPEQIKAIDQQPAETPAQDAPNEDPHIVPASGCLPPLDQMDEIQLRALAEQKGIKIPGTMTKTETIRGFLMERIDDGNR